MTGRGGNRRGGGRGDGGGGRPSNGYRNNRDRDRGGGRRRGHYRDGEDGEGRDRYRGNQRDRQDSANVDEGNQNRPIVLAKSERALEREKMERDFPALVKTEVRKSPSESEEMADNSNPSGGGQGSDPAGNIAAGPGVILVKQRSSAGRSDSPATNTNTGSTANSGTPQSRTTLRREDKSLFKQKQPMKLLDESQSFCDGIADYLGDNQDFLVIGVLGLQNTGKSTILNILAKNSPEEDEIFRVQSFEHQMLAEHCTNGIDVYVNSRRHIFLDCQPLMSASVLDRSVQLEKKNAPEYASSENTIQVHSLQLIGFMFSVCHVVVLVQDWFMDFGLIRLLQGAETLKPVTPTSGDDNQVIEYFPNLVLVHNKCEVADFEEDSLEEIRECYSLAWSKSRLHWKSKDSDSPHLILLPDQEGERADSLSFRIRPRVDIERAGRQLRHQVLNMPRRNLTQTRLSERGWVSLANKTWDNIKNSAFYLEYSRLLP